VFRAKRSKVAGPDRSRHEKELRAAEAALRAAPDGDDYASRKARGEALAEQGKALIRLGRYEDAVERCQLAADLLTGNADAAQAFAPLAAALLALSRFEDVVRVHDRVEKLVAPVEDASIWFGYEPVSLAYIAALRNLERLDDAYKAAGDLAQRLRRAIYVLQVRPARGRDGQLPPSSSEDVAGFNQAFLEKKIGHRRTLVRTLLEQASIARLQRQRAESHVLIDEAIEHSRAVASFPEFGAGHAQALYMRGQLFDEARDIEQATNAYTVAVSQFGDSTDPRVKVWVDRARRSRQALRN
jgi:tetratricopeptide (TPR) repeat protein